MTDLPIPLVALHDCGAILGRRGAGKSATKQLFLEHELDAGHRCVLIDPKGDSWGIRLNPDGTPSRFEVPIFGGEHGDVELRDGMGAMLGQMIAEHDLSCVVDLSGFSLAAMRRFMASFAEALFDHNRAPLTLFVDEADQLAPQTVPSEAARLLHHMERLIRQGRQRGIFMWMLTQRPQVLNKNLLSQAETLIAMKMTTPHDREAIAKWMEAHDPAKAKEVLKELSSLKIGEAFAWVPTADYLERVQFPLFSTYDSGRTPRHGEVIEGVTLPPIDMSAIGDALAAATAEITPSPAPSKSSDDLVVTFTVEKSEAYLRVVAENEKLKRDLAWRTQQVNLVFDMLGKMRLHLKQLLGLENELFQSPAFKSGVPVEVHGSQPAANSPVGEPGTKRQGVEPSPPILPPRSSGEAPQGVTAGETALTRGAKVMVHQLARYYPRALPLEHIAKIAGVSLKSSQWAANKRSFTESNLVKPFVTPGHWEISTAGREHFGLTPQPDTGAALLEFWCQAFPPSTSAMLRTIHAHDTPLDRQTIAINSGVSPTSSSLGAGLKELRDHGLIVERNKLYTISEVLR